MVLLSLSGVIKLHCVPHAAGVERVVLDPDVCLHHGVRYLDPNLSHHTLVGHDMWHVTCARPMVGCMPT